jgi:hypothetical protein
MYPVCIVYIQFLFIWPWGNTSLIFVGKLSALPQHRWTLQGLGKAVKALEEGDIGIRERYLGITTSQPEHAIGDENSPIWRRKC